MVTRYFIGIIVFLFLACAEKKTEAVTASSEIVIENTTEVTQNTIVPSYTFDEFEREFLQQNTTTTYVVNFWATWCKPCIKELPAFEKLNTTYKDKNVKVILVSLDFPEKLESSVIPFIEKQGLQSKIILLDDPNANAWIPKVSEEWSGAIPATVIVKNKLRKFYERSFTYDDLEAELKTIL